MNSDNYCIKSGYKSQERNYTLSVGPADLYWTEERILFSHYFQYDVYRFARKIIKKYHLGSVADIGCGVATKLMKLIYPICREVTGVDQKEAIDYCKGHYSGGKFIADNLEDPKVVHGPYDLVICSDVIEHLCHPDTLLDYIRKICHQNSYIIISTPERDLLRGKGCMSSEKPEHVREWNSEEISQYLTSRGFNIVSHGTSPFIKFSFNKKISALRKTVKKRCGTIKTNQMILCNLK